MMITLAGERTRSESCSNWGLGRWPSSPSCKLFIFSIYVLNKWGQQWAYWVSMFSLSLNRLVVSFLSCAMLSVPQHHYLISSWVCQCVHFFCVCVCSMYMCAYVYENVCSVFMCMCVHVCVCMCVFHVCVCMCIYKCMFSVFVCMCVHVCVLCVCICMFSSVCSVYMCVHVCPKYVRLCEGLCVVCICVHCTCVYVYMCVCASTCVWVLSLACQPIPFHLRLLIDFP